MGIDFFNSETILRLTPLAKNTEVVAKNIISGNVRVFPKLSNIEVNSVDELWEITFDSSPSTYALYVYALYPISYLLNAYEVTGDETYLDNALALSLSFIRWELKGHKNINEKRKKILFGDHALSNRTQVLCYLACCLQNPGYSVCDEIRSALLRNGEYLADSKNYLQYNHGLMMDLALLGLVNTFDGLGIEYPIGLKSNLLTRLQYSITRDLTDDGVHVENSPGYHFWMLSFLGRIITPLQGLDKSLSFRAQEVFKKASEYGKYITRSNGSVPTIGDTHAGVTFSASKNLPSKHFKNANQVIFRDPEYDVWAFFSSGYKTHVHKHCDNGAFNLYHKGQDIFIDPGFLNYEGSSEGAAIKSASFHNTVFPTGKSQSLAKTELSTFGRTYEHNLSQSRVVCYSGDGEIECTLGIIADYECVVVERLIVWIKPSIFFILDSASPCQQGIEQAFHIAPDLAVETGEGVVNLSSVGGQAVAKIEQHLVDGTKRRSIVTNLLPGFCATAFDVKADTKRVLFRTRDSCFLTTVTIFDNGQSPVAIDNFDGSSVQYRRFGELKHLNLSHLKADLLTRSKQQY